LGLQRVPKRDDPPDFFSSGRRSLDPGRTGRCKRRRWSGGCERILLVEDEEGVRKLIRTMLERQGYTVVEASRPDDAQVVPFGDSL
jgi:hypothetical protein